MFNISFLAPLLDPRSSISKLNLKKSSSSSSTTPPRSPTFCIIMPTSYSDFLKHLLFILNITQASLHSIHAALDWGLPWGFHSTINQHRCSSSSSYEQNYYIHHKEAPIPLFYSLYFGAKVVVDILFYFKTVHCLHKAPLSYSSQASRTSAKIECKLDALCATSLKLNESEFSSIFHKNCDNCQQVILHCDWVRGCQELSVGQLLTFCTLNFFQ